MPRAALALVLIAAFLGFSPSASASAPQITLLAPGNGATLAYPAYGNATTNFSWHVSWDTPEVTTVMFQLGTNPGFAAGTYTQENFACPATDPNCTSSYAPPRSYAPPFPKIFYWRVGVTTSAGQVWSATSMFKVVDLADTVKPRVRVDRGSARRGTRARLLVHAADDRGRVRLRVMLNYRGRTLYNGRFPLTPTSWAVPLSFFTSTRLPRFLPSGRYEACVRAWDEAGNTARSCAAYQIR
jgi:hypothetical protein